MSKLTSFEKKVILKVLAEQINKEVKQNPNKRIMIDLSKGKKGNVISETKLEEFLKSQEGRELLKPVIDKVKEVYGEKPRVSKKDLETQRNVVRGLVEGIAKEFLVVGRLIEETKVESAPVVESLPSVEKVEEPVREQPVVKIAGRDFLNETESKDTLKVLNSIANIPSNARSAIRQLLQGSVSVEQFLGRANLTRSFIRNVVSGLSLIYMTPSFGVRQKSSAFDIAQRLGASIIAGATTNEVFRRSKEDFQENGRIKEDRLKGKMRAEKIKEEDPFKPPKLEDVKQIGMDVIERLERGVDENPELKGEIKQAIVRVDTELKDIASTGVLSDLQRELFKLLKPIRDLPASAILVALGSLPIVGEVEIRPEVKTEVKPEVKTEIKTAPAPSPEKPSPAPAPAPTPPSEAPLEEEVKEEPSRMPKAPSALIPDIFSKFTPKQIKVDQEKEEQKSFSKAKPDTIIPATKVLEPYADSKDAKADYQMQVAFDYDIPYTMNGVILEENELMQQVQLENEIRYRDAGLWYGNNDWDIPRDVGFEKKGNPDAVPVLVFNEDYSDAPINPNNTLEQNIIYNKMTNTYPQDGNDNSLRNSVLFGKQPT